MLSIAYMEQQLSKEFAKARQTLTIRPIIVPQKVFTGLKIKTSDYFLDTHNPLLFVESICEKNRRTDLKRIGSYWPSKSRQLFFRN